MAEVDDAPDSKIDEVAEFTGLSDPSERPLLAAQLRQMNGSVNAVIAHYFDDPVQFRTPAKANTWDESLFNSDRNGVADKPEGPSFTIQGPDENGPVLLGVSPPPSNKVPPSRPPSRNQSPLGRIIDLTAQSAAGISTNKSQEDMDMEKALAESRAMSGIQSPQESGVTQKEAYLPHFGPANRPSYDPSEWAMVPANQQTREPGPSARRREVGAPAFLRTRKPEYDNNRHILGAIFTIFHEIPAARNALLGSGSPASVYGSDGDWWKGTHIAAKAQNQGAGGTWETPQPDLAEELHRLMAFLDHTDRSYGTADVISDLHELYTHPYGDTELRFFVVFKETNQETVTKPLFTSTHMWRVCDTTEGDDNAGALIGFEDQQQFSTMDGIIDVELTQQVDTLYNALDYFYWKCLEEDKEHISTVERASDIVTIRLKFEVQPEMQIPEVMYFDRYLVEHKDEALRLVYQLRTVLRARDKAKRLRDELVNWSTADENDKVTSYDQRALSQQFQDRCKISEWSLKSRAAWRKHEERSPSVEEPDYLANIDPLAVVTEEEVNAEELKVAEHYSSLHSLHNMKKLVLEENEKILQEEQEACETLFKRMSMQMTVPSEAEGWNPVHKYTLRGVITSANTMYVCRQPEPHLIELYGEPARQEQWWALGYLHEGSTDAIRAEKTTLEEVLVAATGEGNKRPTLIYANAAAMAATPVSLTIPQHTFVRHDNRLFKQSMIEETPAENLKRDSPNDPDSAGPISPSKRHQGFRADSMDSNRASVGDGSDRDGDDVSMGGLMQSVEPDEVNQRGGGFNGLGGEFGNDGTLGTEMVQLAISRSGHGADGEAAAGPGRDGEMGDIPSGYIADWDHPEGKFVPVIKSVEDDPLHHQW